MKSILLLIESLLYFFCIYQVIKQLYGYRPANRHWIAPLLILHGLCLVLTCVIKTDLSTILYLVLILVDIAVLKCTFKACKLRSVIATFVMLYAVNITASFLCVFITNQIESTAAQMAFGFVLNAVVLLAIMLLLRIKRLHLNTTFAMIPLFIKRIAFLSVIASTIVISILLGYGSVMPISAWPVFLKIAIVFLIAIIGSVLPVLIANAIGKSFYNKQANLFEDQIKVQAKHYEEISKNNFELRRFRHDYKNLLIGLGAFMKEGDTQAVQQLLEKQMEEMNEGAADVLFDTGNGIVDAILSEKQKKAETTNSIINFEGAILTEKIAPPDLCVIFGNTLDNAIEACEKVHTAAPNTISVYCKSTGDFIFVKISNPVDQAPEIQNNSVSTSKSDTANHGFGLYSLKKAIQKYNGIMSIACTDHRFSIDLELTLPA